MESDLVISETVESRKKYLSILANLVQYCIPSAKSMRKSMATSQELTNLCKAMGLSDLESTNFTGLCQALTVLDSSDAMAVLDKDNGSTS